MNEKLKDIFFYLLRIGLWRKEELTNFPELTDEDWSEIHRYAINHTVEGLIFDSFSFLKDNQLPPMSLRLKWAVRIEAIERHNIKMNHVIASQYTIFKKNGLSPILQKGQGVASCYELPLHRTSGDIDWYFENNGYPSARNLIQKMNLQIRDSAGFSLDYNWRGIHIEHHKKLFDIQNPFKSKFLQKLQIDYNSRNQILLINDTPVKILPAELQLLQVNSHILKHLLSFGIGIRQLCDSARLYHCSISKIDKEKLKKIYKDAGILDWTHLLHYILVNYLKLPTDSLPFSIPENLNGDWMLEEIWQSGNFGFHDKRFESGKFTKISRQPDGANRLLLNFLKYFKYVPQEAFFFPIVQTYSRFIGKDKD